MTKSELFEWVRSQYGIEPDHPWKTDAESAVLRNVNQKWFGVVMAISAARLGLNGDALIDVLNVKCDPAIVGSLRAQPGFLPAYHMNKEQWITIRLDGSAPDDTVKALVEQSYAMTGAKGKKRNKEDQ